MKAPNSPKCWDYLMLGGGFNYFFMFTPKIGEDSHFDSYFSDGLVQPPSSMVFKWNIHISSSKMIHLLFFWFTKLTWQIRCVFEVLDLNESSLCVTGF